MHDSSRSGVLMLLCAAPAWAQFETGSITGTVQRQERRRAAGRDRHAAQPRHQRHADHVTNDSGAYEFFTLRVGRYEVKAELVGLHDDDGAGGRAGHRQPPARRPDDGRRRHSPSRSRCRRRAFAWSATRASAVPWSRPSRPWPCRCRAASTRRWRNSSPGVRRSAINNTQGTGREGSFTINGLRSTYNNYLLDGVDNNAYGTSNQGYSNQVIQPPPDALAEMRVVTNNMSAEYGRSGGGTINVAYKSGTNRFSGSGWEYRRDPSLQRHRLLQARGGHRAEAHARPVRLRARRPDPAQSGLLLHRLRRACARTARRSRFSSIPDMTQRQGVLGVSARDPRTGAVYPAGHRAADDRCSRARC